MKWGHVSFSWRTRAGGHKKVGTTVFRDNCFSFLVATIQKGERIERYQVVSFSFSFSEGWHELPWIFLQPFNALTQQQSSCPHPPSPSLWPSITIIITPQVFHPFLYQKHHHHPPTFSSWSSPPSPSQAPYTTQSRNIQTCCCLAHKTLLSLPASFGNLYIHSVVRRV